MMTDQIDAAERCGGRRPYESDAVRVHGHDRFINWNTTHKQGALETLCGAAISMLPLSGTSYKDMVEL
jgi:hypothetical protein